MSEETSKQADGDTEQHNLARLLVASLDANRALLQTNASLRAAVDGAIGVCDRTFSRETRAGWAFVLASLASLWAAVWALQSTGSALFIVVFSALSIASSGALTWGRK